MTQQLLLNLSSIKSLPPGRRKTVLAELLAMTPEEQAAGYYLWPFWQRPSQTLPPGDWLYWLILAGRGAGKTRSGAEAVRHWIYEDGEKYVNLIAATEGDIDSVMINGESGIMEICPYYERPRYVANRHRLYWPNGAVSRVFSAEKPGRLRGPQHAKLWCDEIAAWQRPAAWTMAQFGLRLGTKPQAVITTTPTPTKIIRDLVKDEGTIRTGGSTYENRANLAGAFIKRIITQFEGTRLGRQELNAEILDDVPNALWTREMIERARNPEYCRQMPDFLRVVVAVDPSGAGKTDEDDNPMLSENSDEIGIVVAAKGVDGRMYVLADRTIKASPAIWGSRVVKTYKEFLADRVVAEINFGGAMVQYVIKTSAEAGSTSVPVKIVTASRGKVVRAQPVSALYEQGRVSHVGNPKDRSIEVRNDLAALEDQLCQMTPSGYLGDGSPDRLDALVWAATELMLEGDEPMNITEDILAMASRKW